MTYLVAEFVLSSVGSCSGEFFFNVTKVTASSRLIIVLGKDEFSFANVSVFLGWGRGWKTTQRLTFSNYMLSVVDSSVLFATKLGFIQD